MTIEKILFYGIIIVGAALIIGLTYYRIDWARHPEKYRAVGPRGVWVSPVGPRRGAWLCGG